MAKAVRSTAGGFFRDNVGIPGAGSHFRNL